MCVCANYRSICFNLMKHSLGPDAIGGFGSMDRGGDEDGGDLVDGKGAEWAFCSLGVSGSKDGRKTSRKPTSHGQSIMHPMDNPMDNPMVI